MSGEAAQDPYRDGRLSAPSALRNRDTIAAVLATLAPPRGRALEIASGTGEHVIHFAAVMPGLQWQPSDPDPLRRASITAWTARTDAPSILPPMPLDACTPGWSAQTGPQDLIFVANLLHLVTHDQASDCLTEMAQALAPGGRAIVYGPFLRNGQATSPGDAEFDAILRAEGRGIGYKDLALVQSIWTNVGLIPDTPRPMPANNLLLCAAKPAQGPKGT